jgi:hypothetical protein
MTFSRCSTHDFFMVQRQSRGTARGPVYLPKFRCSAFAFSSQYVMPMSPYIAVAVVRSWH